MKFHLIALIVSLILITKITCIAQKNIQYREYQIDAEYSVQEIAPIGEYIAIGTDDGLYIYSPQKELELVQYLDVEHVEFIVYDFIYFYCTNNDNKVFIYEFVGYDFNTIKKIAEYDFESKITSVFANSGYLFVGTFNEEDKQGKLNICDPFLQDIPYRIDTQGEITSIYATENKLIFAEKPHKIYIYDWKNNSPEYLSLFQGVRRWVSGMILDKNYLYYFEIFGRKLSALDIENPKNPSLFPESISIRTYANPKMNLYNNRILISCVLQSPINIINLKNDKSGFGASQIIRLEDINKDILYFNATAYDDSHFYAVITTRKQKSDDFSRTKLIIMPIETLLHLK